MPAKKKASKTKIVPETPWSPDSEQEAPVPKAAEIDSESVVSESGGDTTDEANKAPDEANKAPDEANKAPDEAPVDGNKTPVVHKQLTFAECKAIQKKTPYKTVTLTSRRKNNRR